MISNPVNDHAKLFHMKFLTLILILVLSSVVLAHEDLDQFETDFCTNYPEGTNEQPNLWKHCCLIHDMYFWAGGSKSDRDVADLDLKSCIEETGAYRQASLMYYAVRAGSYSPIKYPKRKWNNGWNDGRKVRSLSFEDVDLVESEITSGYDYISSDIKSKFITTLRSRLD